MRVCLRGSGFTLVEVLVVIAIIVVLAALLLPVYEQCLKKAESASCLSNLRSLLVAAAMYADDCDNHLPPALVPAAPPTYCTCWDVVLYPYLRNHDIYRCPSDQVCSPGPSWTYSFPHSYGVNLALTLVGGYMGVSLNQERLTRPSETVLFFELNQAGGYGWRPEWGNPEQYLAKRHLDGANFAFCGGNVKWMQPDYTLAGAGMWQP